jgi:phosphoribosylformimino-5-aminoimidazole carboxamide ribotide isomerase
MLHVADLDGAFEGRPVNLQTAAQMRREFNVPVEIGGGFRDLKGIETAVKAGLDKVILGTIAVSKPELVREAVREFDGRVSVSIDVSGDFVTVSGWTAVSQVRFEDLVKRMQDEGVSELLFTDTRKDGTLSGPNIESIKRFLKVAKVPVIASGGISRIEDVEALKQLVPDGLKGAVIGKALYDGKINLQEALARAG